MSIEKLIKKDLPEIPNEIKNALIKNKITLTPFDEMNDILKSGNFKRNVKSSHYKCKKVSGNFYDC